MDRFKGDRGRPVGTPDLAIAPDGAILCLYECGIIERMADDKHLTLARFDLDWVLNPSGS